MRILAIDTATESCSAALVLEGRALSRERLLEREHATYILQMVDELLADAGIALANLSAIAFGRGPGAFTGVRLAACVTQGLAYGAGIPVVPISDLRAIAERALEDASLARVLVCTDARMREVYWGCFERGTDGHAVAAGEEQVGPPGEVALPQRWHDRAQGQAAEGSALGAPAPPAGRIGAAGSGFAAHPELRTGAASRATTILETLRPHAREVAILAGIEVAAGRLLPPEQALPLYLRDEVVRRRPSGH